MGAVYTQLSIEERHRSERWRHARVPVREIARVLIPVFEVDGAQFMMAT